MRALSSHLGSKTVSLIKVLVLSVLMAAGTWLVGWYAVPCLATVYALVMRSKSAPSEATIAALLAWSALLARVAVRPAFTTLLDRLTVLFKMPGTIVVLLTIGFAAALAWSAARVVSAIVVRTPARAA
jgi:hypothetical protein